MLGDGQGIGVLEYLREVFLPKSPGEPTRCNHVPGIYRDRRSPVHRCAIPDNCLGLSLVGVSPGLGMVERRYPLPCITIRVLSLVQSTRRRNTQSSAPPVRSARARSSHPLRPRVWVVFARRPTETRRPSNPGRPG